MAGCSPEDTVIGAVRIRALAPPGGMYATDADSVIEALGPDGEWFRLRGVTKATIVIEHRAIVAATIDVELVEVQADALDSAVLADPEPGMSETRFVATTISNLRKP
jgi:hypothetical protein